jgi:hypothetical protein
MPLARLAVIEKAVILGAWLLPAILMFGSWRIQFGPLVSLAMLIVVIRHIHDAATPQEALA